jgi:hypothetical protein
MEDGYKGLGSAYRGTSDEELYWLMAVEKRDKQRTARRSKQVRYRESKDKDFSFLNHSQ